MSVAWGVLLIVDHPWWAYAGLMGGGAVIALGCTIGQGVSALSVLAYGAPLSFAAIFAGAALGLRQLERAEAMRGEREAVAKRYIEALGELVGGQCWWLIITVPPGRKKSIQRRLSSISWAIR